MQSQAIFCFTDNLGDIIYISWCRPGSFVIFPHWDLKILKKASSLFGIFGFLVKKEDFLDREILIKKCEEVLKEFGIEGSDDMNVVCDIKNLNISLKKFKP